MPTLPPLNAIKVFEVAARAGSFTRAAAELGVSATAVSQQIRNLEIWFGKQLFVRSGNRIAMTDAGHAIYPQVSRALGDIASMSTRLLDGELRAQLVVSVPVSIAEPWLLPRMATLLETVPRLAIDIRAEDDPIDLARQNIDVRISYGDYHYPGLKMTPLMHDEVLPVCSPSFWRARGADQAGLSEMAESLFIHTNWGPSYASHPTWGDWFAKTGSPRRPDPAQGRRLGLSSLAVSSARLGLGVALGQRLIAQADLEAGRLIALSSTSLRLGHPYCAFVPPARAARAEIRALIALLQDAGGD